MKNKHLNYYPRKIKLLSVVLIFSLASSGCAGLINMHPRADEITEFTYANPVLDAGKPTTDKYGNVAFNSEFQGGLPLAIDAANAQRNIYIEAGNNQSLARNVGAIALTGISAAALYVGITANGAQDALAALGIAGAGLLGLDSFFLSKPLQGFYYKASQTVGCAVMSMRPYLETKENHKDLECNVDDLGLSLSKLQSKIISIDPLLTPFSEADSIFQIAKAEVAAAKAVKQQGELAFIKGTETLHSIDVAGVTLRLHVRNIMDTVDIEIAKNEPSLDSLVGILGGLGGVAGQVVPFVDFTPKPPKPPKVETDEKGGEDAAALEENTNKLEIALNNLRESRENSINNTEKVERFVNKVTALAEKVGEIENCQVPTIDINFAVTPNVDEIEVAKDSTILFAIKNDSGIPSASFAGLQPGKNSEVKVELKNGAYQAIVVISADANPGEVLLVIRDGTNQLEKLIKLIIVDQGGSKNVEGDDVNKKDTDKDVSKPAKSPTKDTTDPDPFPLNKFQIIEMQVHFNKHAKHSNSLKVDGELGNETRAEIKKFKQRKGIKEEDTKVTEEFWKALLKEIQPVPISKAGDIVNIPTNAEKIGEENIKGIQKGLIKLGFPNTESGKFDIETRQAILDFQKEYKLPQTGKLSSIDIIEAINECGKSDVGCEK